MTDHPILFSAPMVRALLEGRKTQTRRVINPQPEPAFISAKITDGLLEMAPARLFGGPTHRTLRKTRRPGDRLWVREAWRTWRVLNDTAPRDLQSGGLSQSRAAIWYEATPNEDQKVGPLKHEIGRLRASMHMPRWASRLTLKVTEVRIQHLQDISYDDAEAEGIEGSDIDGWRCYFPEPKNQDAWVCPRESFRTLWDSLNAGRGFGWDANPWVVATSFHVEKINIDEVKS